jgi:peptide/nickel transport system substrate-binding protein
MWTTAAIGGEEGTNYSGYSNRTFDAFVDSGLKALDVAAARGYYRRAYETIVQDAPAIWLYETKNYAAHHRRVHLVGLRADAWWARIADWTIPTGERIGRDRIGVVARAR